MTTDRAEERDPGRPIRTPPLIYRVWHEGMPPAAVNQGFTETIWDNGGSTATESNHPVEYLPFRCDQAVVMLRGFRAAFLDGWPRPLVALKIDLDVHRDGGRLTIAPSFNSGFQTVGGQKRTLKIGPGVKVKSAPGKRGGADE